MCPYEFVAKDTAANGVDKVWQCYVAGISPTNAASRFMAIIAVDANGMPPKVQSPKSKVVENVEGRKWFLFAICGQL